MDRYSLFSELDMSRSTLLHDLIMDDYDRESAGVIDFLKEVALPAVLKEHGCERKSRMMREENVIDLTGMSERDIFKQKESIYENFGEEPSSIFNKALPCFLSGVYVIPKSGKKLYARYRVKELEPKESKLSMDVEFYMLENLFVGFYADREWTLMAEAHISLTDGLMKTDSIITGRVARELLFDVARRKEMANTLYSYTGKRTLDKRFDEYSYKDLTKKRILWGLTADFFSACMVANQTLENEKLSKGQREKKADTGTPKPGTEPVKIYGEPAAVRYIRKAGAVTFTSKERPEQATERIIHYTKASWPARGGIKHYRADRYVNMKGKTGYFKPSVHHRGGLTGQESKETLIITAEKKGEAE